MNVVVASRHVNNKPNKPVIKKCQTVEVGVLRSPKGLALEVITPDLILQALKFSLQNLHKVRIAMAGKDGSEDVKTTFDRISSGGGDSEFWSALGGLGLRGIRGESDRLEREKTLLNDTKRSLAFDHYRSVLCACM